MPSIKQKFLRTFHLNQLRFKYSSEPSEDLCRGMGGAREKRVVACTPYAIRGNLPDVPSHDSNAGYAGIYLTGCNEESSSGMLLKLRRRFDLNCTVLLGIGRVNLPFIATRFLLLPSMKIDCAAKNTLSVYISGKFRSFLLYCFWREGRFAKMGFRNKSQVHCSHDQIF